MSDREELERRASNGDVDAMVDLAAALRVDQLHEFLVAVRASDLTVVDEETELLHLISLGDEDALQRLVESQLRSVVSIAKDYRGQGVLFLKLISAGVVGCVCGIWAYRETSPDGFRVTVREYVRHAVLIAVELFDGGSRHVTPDEVEQLCESISDCMTAMGASGDGALDPVMIRSLVSKLSVAIPALRVLSEPEAVQRQRQMASEADAWLSRAVELGSSEAMDELARRALMAGDMAAAGALSQQGAEAGNVRCMTRLAQLAGEAGDAPSEREWYERAAEAGSVHAMHKLASAARRRGDTAGFREWSERAVEAGSSKGWNDLGHILVEAGDLEAARPLLAKSAGAGYNMAFATLGQLELAAGNAEAAKTWWLIAAGRNETNSMVLLAELVEEVGETELAREWYAGAALLGHAEAMFELSVRCERAGEDANARYWRLRAAARGWGAPE